MDDLQTICDDIAEEMRAETDRGRVADYIPDLACISPDQFGIAIARPDGTYVTAGDAQTPFSVQSITKVFTLTMALAKVGEELTKRVGVEPSGSAFNSIVQLESECGIPRNPFINAGAIVVADVLLSGRKPQQVIEEFQAFVQDLVGPSAITIDDKVAEGEARTGYRNFALANYMRSFGNLHHPTQDVLDIYFHQCALAMNAEQLALSGRYLMCGGENPVSNSCVVGDRRARRILALMLTCGHYDGSGEFAFRVGLPGKSGVGGGILAMVPGIASIAVWSPGLNERGNSKLGTAALERLVQRTGWSVFDAPALSDAD